MSALNLKEKTAVELKYLGNSVKDISQKIDTPFDTVNGWFKSNGRLHFSFQKFSELMNEKRQKNLEDKITISDREFFIITTNVVRQMGKRLQKRKVPLVNKQGKAVADDNGNLVYVEVESNEKFSVRDLLTVWKMQRVMKGLPISYTKKEINQDNFEADKVIKELGLTDEDFHDDKLEETSKKIRVYLESQ